MVVVVSPRFPILLSPLAFLLHNAKQVEGLLNILSISGVITKTMLTMTSHTPPPTTNGNDYRQYSRTTGTTFKFN